MYDFNIYIWITKVLAVDAYEGGEWRRGIGLRCGGRENVITTNYETL